MKRALFILALVVPAAHAAPFQPPGAWPRDDVASDKLTAQHGQIDVGGVRVTSRLDSFVAPSKHATLWLTRTVAVAPLDQQQVIARVFAEGELGTPITIVQRTDKLVDITGPSTGDPALAKKLTIVSDGERMIGLMAECISVAEVTTGELAACKAALSDIDPELAIDKRVAFSVADTTVVPTQRTAPGPTTDQPTMQLPSAQLGDGDNVKIAPTVIRDTSREKDRRPVYVGIGLVAFAALFWFNRKRRETFDRSDAPPPKKNRADDDADDLHAAARGEDKDNV